MLDKEKFDRIKELSNEEKNLMKCEFSDDFLKRKYYELGDNITWVFKCFIKINKLGKIKEEKNKNLINDLEEFRIRYFDIRELIYKLIDIKKFMNENNEILNDLKIQFISNFDEEVKNNLFENLKIRKNLLLVIFFLCFFYVFFMLIIYYILEI